jgi:hypothetical protein
LPEFALEGGSLGGTLAAGDVVEVEGEALRVGKVVVDVVEEVLAHRVLDIALGIELGLFLALTQLRFQVLHLLLEAVSEYSPALPLFQRLLVVGED